MNDLIHIDLSEHERDILLKGLRHVRRSVMLETRDPSVNDELRRSGLLDEIQNLAQRLETSGPLATTEI